MRRFILAGIIFITIALLAVFAEGVRRSLREPPPTPRVTVTIPEGFTVREVNVKLTEAGVLSGEELPESLEGYLFPDTYEFFVPSGIGVVEEKFRENFESKMLPILPEGIGDVDLREVLTIASYVEKEVPDSDERKMVAGIVWKRFENGMLLQIDSSLCYTKGTPCLPITKEDKESDSLYNTYRYSGLTPSPIGNPGLDAIGAVLNPTVSPYWYYLSDPETGKTVFAKTLDEHNSNIVKYLGD